MNEAVIILCNAAITGVIVAIGVYCVKKNLKDFNKELEEREDCNVNRIKQDNKRIELSLNETILQRHNVLIEWIRRTYKATMPEPATLKEIQSQGRIERTNSVRPTVDFFSIMDESKPELKYSDAGHIDKFGLTVALAKSKRLMQILDKYGINYDAKVTLMNMAIESSPVFVSWADFQSYQGIFSGHFNLKEV